MWSSGQLSQFSETSTEPLSQGGLFTTQQTARGARSKCQGQWDCSPPPGNGAKVFAPDLGRWSPSRWIPCATGSQPQSCSSEKKRGSPRSVAKRHHWHLSPWWLLAALKSPGGWGRGDGTPQPLGSCRIWENRMPQCRFSCGKKEMALPPSW